MRVRLLIPRLAASTVIEPKLRPFAHSFPDVVLDVTTDDSRIDLVAAGFDAGIQFGEFIQQDMVAVRVSPDMRPAIVGSPEYFETHRTPKTPADLRKHRCVNFRHGDTGLYHWELDKGRRSLAVAGTGPLIVDDLELSLRAAADGVGLAYVSEDGVAEHLARGSLVGRDARLGQRLQRKY